jgi:hypothetical protein
VIYLLWHLLISRWRNRKAIAERARRRRVTIDIFGNQHEVETFDDEVKP